jgi:hypothetical protein
MLTLRRFSNRRFFLQTYYFKTFPILSCDLFEELQCYFRTITSTFSEWAKPRCGFKLLFSMWADSKQESGNSSVAHSLRGELGALSFIVTPILLAHKLHN